MDNRAVSLIIRPAVLIVTQPGSRFSRNHQEDGTQSSISQTAESRMWMHHPAALPPSDLQFSSIQRAA